MSNQSNEPKAIAKKSMALAEGVSQVWSVSPPPGITTDELLLPDTWRHVGGFIGRGDILRVIDETTGLFAELLCREGRESNRSGFATMALLRVVDLPPVVSGEDDKLPAGHSVQWLGDAQKWGSMRGTQILRHGFNTKAEALAYFGDLAMAGAL